MLQEVELDAGEVHDSVEFGQQLVEDSFFVHSCMHAVLSLTKF